jgi:hypothetical protein
MMPPGKYRIETLIAQQGSMQSEAKVAEGVYEFEVTADAVTDLGLLIVQPVGNSKAVLVQAPDPIKTRVALDRLGKKADGWLDKPVIDWHPQNGELYRFNYGSTDASMGLIVDLMNIKFDKDAALAAQARWDNAKTATEVLAIGKQATYALSAPAVTPDGTMYFGSNLGQVLRRSSGGEWSALDTGTSVVISAVTLDNGVILAGTEDGRIVRLDGDRPTVVHEVVDHGRIVNIKHWSDGSWWVASQVESGKLTTNIYAGASLPELSGTPLKSVVQNTPTAFMSPKPYANVVGGNGKYFVSIGDSELHAYDKATDKWEAAPRVKKAAVPVESNNDGSVLFSMRPAMVSDDDGTTWREFRPGGTLFALAFFDTSNGLGLFGVDKMSWSGAQELRSTADGGKTWTVVNKLDKSPCDVRSIRQNDVQKRVVCVFNDGNIYSSGATGSWVLERSAY